MESCLCCKANYEVTILNYYNLCDSCFSQFDRQKMNGRFNRNPKSTDFYTESADVYIKSGRCTHQKMTTFSEYLQRKIDNNETHINLLGFN
jgi:hypothetical protein